MQCGLVTWFFARTLPVGDALNDAPHRQIAMLRENSIPTHVFCTAVLILGFFSFAVSAIRCTVKWHFAKPSPDGFSDRGRIMCCCYCCIVLL